MKIDSRRIEKTQIYSQKKQLIVHTLGLESQESELDNLQEESRKE